jgi:hypothetical protein
MLMWGLCGDSRPRLSVERSETALLLPAALPKA